MTLGQFSISRDGWMSSRWLDAVLVENRLP